MLSEAHNLHLKNVLRNEKKVLQHSTIRIL